MEISLGNEQVYTSARMLKYPRIGKFISKTFGYTNIGNYARFQVFKRLLRQLPMNEFNKILDLGCGYGEYAMGIAKIHPNAQVHALDIDIERTEIVKDALKSCDLNNVQVHTRKIEEIKEDKIDFIYSVDVFEHIAPGEMPFESSFEKLKPGGFLMVKIPNVTQKTILPDNWFEDHNHWLEDEHIGQVYDLEGLKTRFEESGFEIIFSQYSDGIMSRAGWEIAYMGKKLGVVTQLLSIPISKTLILLDKLFHYGNWGNAIQVIGKKPL